jgi:hypothetical protein
LLNQSIMKTNTIVEEISVPKLYMHQSNSDLRKLNN